MWDSVYVSQPAKGCFALHLLVKIVVLCVLTSFSITNRKSSEKAKKKEKYKKLQRVSTSV